MKFHIGRDGMPKVCKAHKGKCPFGGAENHFSTFAEASRVSDIRHAEQYVKGYADMIKPDTSMVDARTLNSNTFAQEFYVDKTSTVHKQSRTQYLVSNLKEYGKFGARRGFDAETFSGVAYANDLNANNTLMPTPPDGALMYTEQTGNVDDDTMLNSYSKNREALFKAVDKLPENNIDRNILVRAMHLSDDGKTAVVQMGAPNAPDLAIIKNGKVEFVEVKDLHKDAGSQIDSYSSTVNDDNYINLDDSKLNLPEKIQENLKIVGFNKTVGTNYPLNTLTYNESLQYFVKSQQEKGNSRFGFIGRDNKFHDVSLKGDPEDIANKLQEEGIEGTLLMRSNQVSVTLKENPSILDHWKKKRTAYFKDNKWPNADAFKLSDLNLKDNVSVVKGKLCVGEMMLPIKCKDVNHIKQLNMDTVINLNSVRARQLTFTGTLKQR